jgi:hypothetical protein
MRWGILQAQLSRFDEIGEQAEGKSAWKRQEGFNLTYTLRRRKYRAITG